MSTSNGTKGNDYHNKNPDSEVLLATSESVPCAL